MKVKTIKIVIDCSKLPHYGEEDRPDNTNMYEVNQLLERLAHDLIWAEQGWDTQWGSAGTYGITHPNGTEAATITLEEAE